MGARGPRKKLPSLERLEGSPGKRRIIDSGIEPFGDVFVPEHLCDDARGCIEVIRRSMPPKVYSALDTFLLSAFAKAWAVHKRAAHEINAPGFVWIVKNSTGSETPNPWIKVLNSQAQLLASLGDRLGLDPKARAGLKLPAEKPKSRFDGLIGQRVSSPSLNA